MYGAFLHAPIYLHGMVLSLTFTVGVYIVYLSGEDVFDSLHRGLISREIMT